MWDWLKRFFSTNTPRKQDALELAFLSQQKLLEKIVLKQQATIDAQQASLDRVLTSQFEKPIERIVHPQPNNQFPLFGLDDQGSFPEPDPIQTGLANLHLDSDKAFLESVN